MSVGFSFHKLCQLVLAALGFCGLAGCAHTYFDNDGNRHVIGWVDLTLPPSNPEPKAAEWMRVRTVGLVLSRTEIGSALELGYADSTLAAIRNDSCVLLDRLPSPLHLSPGVTHASLSTNR